jgi:chromosome segregation ATPase
MSDSLAHYWDALDRLKKRKAKINNDTVAIEAGRKKGSIKKSREQFADLIAAIDRANAEALAPEQAASRKLADAKEDSKSLQAQLDAAHARELSLLQEVFELRKELAQLRGGNIIPIRDQLRGGVGHAGGSMADDSPAKRTIDAPV